MTAPERQLITASEVARHVFCARALAYDRQAPGQRSQHLLAELWRVIRTPWMLGVLSFSMVLLSVVYSPIIALAALLTTLVIFISSALLVVRLRNQATVIIYRQAKAERNRQMMVASEFGLSGKPDYLLRLDAEALIPVLVKQNPSQDVPHDPHIMQIIAHCLLVAETHHSYPPYGIIRYGDGRTFEIDFDQDSVEVLSQLMDDIEADRTRKKPPERNHEERGRCYACCHRQHCDQNLFT